MNFRDFFGGRHNRGRGREGMLDNFFSSLGLDDAAEGAAAASGQQQEQERNNFFQQAGLNQNELPFGDNANRSTPTTAVPASTRIRNKLPAICIRPEDLLDPANRECSICLDDPFTVGDQVTRLPCAHFYHRHCIQGWLSQSCTCPICRFELPTDDPSYEIGRLQRMRHRRPRFSRHELERMRILDLKNLMRRPPAAPLVDKSSLVDYLIQSNAVELVLGAPEPVSYKLSTLQNMSVKQLKHVMNEEAGVFYDPKHVVEKQDLLQIFVLSGRLDVLPEEVIDLDSDNDEEEEDQKPAAIDMSSEVQDWKPNPQSSVQVETVVESDTEECLDPDDVSPLPDGVIMQENIGFAAAPAARRAAAKATRREVTMKQSLEPHNGLTSTSCLKPPPPRRAEEYAEDASHSKSISEETCPPAVAIPMSNMETLSCKSATEEKKETMAGKESFESDISSHLLTSIQELLQHLNFSDIHSMATELEVDVSDYLAQRELLDRNMTSVLVEAGKKKGWSSSDTAQFLRQPPSRHNSDSDVLSNNKRPRSYEPETGNSHSEHIDSSNVRVVPPRTSYSEQLAAPVDPGEMRAEGGEMLAGNGKSAAINADGLNERLFDEWSVSEIRALATEARIDLSFCHESRDAMLATIRREAIERPHVARYINAFAPLALLSVQELRDIAREWQVSVFDCIEKGEILNRLIGAITK
jgi:Ring finger domain